MSRSNDHAFANKLILLPIVLAVGIALGVYIEKNHKTQKFETKIQSDSAQVGDAVKSSVQKAGAAAVEVKNNLASGAQKVVSVATNVAAQVKTGVTNAVDEIKEKLN